MIPDLPGYGWSDAPAAEPDHAPYTKRAMAAAMVEVMEKLGRDVDRGYKVAATGEIFLDGQVGPIGGIEQKTIGARRSGVDIMLVPAGDNAKGARKYAGHMRVIAVDSFQQALHALATLPRKR